MSHEYENILVNIAHLVTFSSDCIEALDKFEFQQKVNLSSDLKFLKNLAKSSISGIDYIKAAKLRTRYILYDSYYI